jgi:tetratricopeptide (TPR) repeat protein
MLYSLLPPLIFFGSLSGVIAIIARVMLRLRHTHQYEEAIAQARQETSERIADLTPEQKHLDIKKNRFMLVREELKNLGNRSRKVFSHLRLKRLSIRRVKEGGQAAHQAGRDSFKAALTKVKTFTDSSSTVIKNTAVPLVKSALPNRRIRLRRIDRTVAPAGAPTTPTIPPAEPAVAAPTTPLMPAIFSVEIKNEFENNTALNAATQALAAAQYAECERIVVPYIVEHARDVRAYLLLGQVAVAKEQWEEATEVFQQVLTLDPDNVEAQAALGYASLRAGHLTQALKMLQRAHEKDPANSGILQNLLIIARRLDNTGLQSSIQAKLAALPQTGV